MLKAVPMSFFKKSAPKLYALFANALQTSINLSPPFFCEGTLKVKVCDDDYLVILTLSAAKGKNPPPRHSEGA